MIHAIHQRVTLLAAGVALFIGAASSLRATDFTWAVANTGYWEFVGPWGGTYPTITDNVTVINPGGAPNTLVVAPPSPSPGTWTGTGYSQTLTMNSTTGFQVNLEVYSALVTLGNVGINNRARALVSTGTWVAVGDVSLGGSESTLVVTSTGLFGSANGYIGNGTGATGTATVMNGGKWITNDGTIYVGNNGGSGLLQVASSGSMQADSVFIASGSSTSQGTVALFGTEGGAQGTLAAYNVVRSVGSGSLIFDGGILKARRNEANFVSGFTGNSLGIANNGAFIDSNGFNIGITSGFVGQGGLAKIGSGTLTMSGSNSYGGSTAIRAGGIAVGGGGVINSPSGTITVGAGSRENGSLTVNAGGRVIATQMFVGSSGSSIGSVTVAGGTLNLASMTYANSGTGSLTISGGSVTSGTAFFGSATGTSSINVSGGSWTNSNDIFMGRTSVLLTGGTVTSGNNTILSAYANTASRATISGGVWTSSNFFVVGFAGSGSLQVNGGTVNANNGLIVGYDTPGTGAVTLSSGTLSAAWVAVLNSGSGKLALNGGTLRALSSQSAFLSGFGTGSVTLANSAAIDTNGFNIGISTVLTGNGTLVKRGAGTLTLGGTQGYTGGTVVEDGVLLITGDISDTGDIFVDANATLGGTGTVGNVHVGDLGTLAPGSSPGLLTIEGNLTMDANSILAMEFSGTGTTQFDRLAVSGLFNANGAILSLGVNYAANLGDSFLVFTDGTPALGAFTIETNLGGGLSWDISRLNSDGILTIVPEPGSLGLAALGLIALASRTRRRR